MGPFFLVILAILGFLVSLLALLVGLYAIDALPWFLRRLFTRLGGARTCPEFTEPALQARQEYADRLDRYVRSQETQVRRTLYYQPGSDPLSPSCSLSEPTLQCIGSLLTRDGRTYLLLPSGDSQPDLEGVGRTAIILRLLNLRPKYAHLMATGATWSEPEEGGSLISAEGSSGAGEWRLLAGDLAWLSVVQGRLYAMPTQGERPGLLWDLSRHLYRSTDLSYQTGRHREPGSPARERLGNIFGAVSIPEILAVYGQVTAPVDVDEILIVRRDPKLRVHPCELKANLSETEQVRLLERGLCVSSDSHGSPFWERSERQLRKFVRYFVDRLTSAHLPRVRELVLSSHGSDVPGFVYDRAKQAIEKGKTTTREEAESPGELIVGVDRFNALLMESFGRSPRIRMLVTSGEKVFQDGSFWRRITQLSGNLELEILMLDPECSVVREREEKSYPDKPSGFLASEIRKNQVAIKRVARYLEERPSNASVKCWLYSERPHLRITLLGERRSVVAHYLPGLRTGDETVFFDLFGHRAVPLVGAIEREYERVKAEARKVV